MLGNHVTMSEALMVTVVCMVTVFIVLFFLSLIMGSFKYVLKDSKIEDKKDTEINEIHKNNDAMQSSEFINLDDLKSEEDIVACMAAAIAASSCKKNSRIHIRSIKRIK